MNTKSVIMMGISAVLFVVGLVGRLSVKMPDAAQQTDAAVLKKIKKKRRLFLFIAIFAVWMFLGVTITALSGMKNSMEVQFDMFSPRTEVFGGNLKLFGKTFTVANTTLLAYKITAIITVLAVVFRLFVFPRFKDKPKGFQNIIELAVEAMDNFTKTNVCDYSSQLSPYMFSLALFMLGCAASELFGLRAPTSDIVMTLAMGLITFFLINFYGIKKKGIGGRLGALTKPTPIIFPMKVLSDVAVPISLACRLFGNMLGGMIVMDLLKGALGGYASGIPAVAGLYFNLFHPIIQIYIFIILSLTFINEAME